MPKKLRKTTKNTAKKTKKLTRLPIFTKKFIFISLAVIGVLFTCTLLLLTIILTSELNRVNKQWGSHMSKAFDGASKMLGVACGVLSTSEANTILGEPVKRLNHTRPSIFYNNLTDKEGTKVGTYEGCTYDAEANNQKYISVSVERFSDEGAAAQFYEKNYVQVPEEVKILPNTEGDRLIYSYAGYIFLDGEQILQVSASNGDTAQNEAFAKPIFDKVLAEMH